MVKSITTIYIDSEVLSEFKKTGKSVSAICNAALMLSIGKIEQNIDDLDGIEDILTTAKRSDEQIKKSIEDSKKEIMGLNNTLDVRLAITNMRSTMGIKKDVGTNTLFWERVLKELKENPLAYPKEKPIEKEYI